MKHSKIFVIGMGMAGCSAVARLVELGVDKDRIIGIEKTEFIGGLCREEWLHDKRYCVHGPHSFHTNLKVVWDFVNRYSSFTDYKHRKGIMLDGELMAYPLIKEQLHLLPAWYHIEEELRNLPKEPNPENFETWCVSKFGPTLYNKMIYEYTKKVWLREPSTLPSGWAPKRLKWGTLPNYLFGDEMQGIPVNGYAALCISMMSILNEENFHNTRRVIHKDFSNGVFRAKTGDIIIVTSPIEEFWNYCHGNLGYVGVKWNHRLAYSHEWPNDQWGTINYPQHPSTIRICNQSIIYQQGGSLNIIGEEVSDNTKMYPVNSKEYDEIYNYYAFTRSKQFKVIPAGRLGLFKYLDMDEAVLSGMDAAEQAYAELS